MIKKDTFSKKLPDLKKKSKILNDVVQETSNSKIQVASPKIIAHSPKQIHASPSPGYSKAKHAPITPLLLTPKSKRVSFSREDHVKEFSKSSRIKVVEIDMSKSPKSSALKRKKSKT